MKPPAVPQTPNLYAALAGDTSSLNPRPAKPKPKRRKPKKVKS
jgi:hypothetical protein